LTEIQSLIPGWKGRINRNKLFIYNIEFNRNDLEPSVLNYYIRRGEYKSEIPIGISKTKNKYYLITTKRNMTDLIITIHTYIGKIKEMCSRGFVFENETYISLIHSSLDLLLVEVGYESPLRVRTFLGKSAKGKLSYRKEKIETIELNYENSKINIDVYKSVNFNVFLDSNLDFIITCLPNYEFYDPLVDLPITAKKKSLIENNEKYQSTIFLTPKRFFERFEEYNKILLNNFTRNDFIQEFEEIKNYFFENLEREAPFFIDPLNIEVFLDAEFSFELQMLKIFKKNIKKLPSIDITVLIDNFDSNQSEKSKILQNYISLLNSCPFFDVKKVIKYVKIDKISFFDEKVYYLIIDDESPGANYIHDYVKKVTTFSKGIFFSTIEKVHDFDKHFLLMYLSLYFRTLNKIPWFKKTHIEYKRIIYFNFYYEFSLNMFKLSLISLNLTNFKISHSKQIFFSSSEEDTSNVDIIHRVIKSLNSDHGIPNQYDLYLFTESKYSRNFIDEISDNSTCILLNKPFSRIFKIIGNNNNTKYIPKNGTFIQLFDNQKLFLIVTTGDPDYSTTDDQDKEPKGIPNPLSVEFFSKKEVHSYKDILQLLFDLSFYYPISFSKTTLPFIIPLANYQLFEKIPAEYNKENPF